MELVFVWNNFESQKIFFMFYQHIFATKTLETTLTKPFFVIIFCLMKHKSGKIFNVHIMQFIIINQKQQTYWVFNVLIRKINWKKQPIFVTKYVNANIAFYFNIVKIFLFYKKLSSTVIKFFSNFFVDIFYFSWMFFWRLIYLTWHHKNYFWSSFLMLISLFLGCFNSFGKSI